ncbi:hypothetical protein C1645_835429 [Glomus cerebriforme]|uniref:Uncharacterized protein n=1 Tax=Glomus cerebriforme TaxID=658196 RepID=A0A397SEG1_9GLOM|nr:hypothetical protein C1645_835429 [Glomus cerebriforme]
MTEIDYYLTDMKKNRPDYYAACDKDCAICGVKLCCHFEGQPCENNKNSLNPERSGLGMGDFHAPLLDKKYYTPKSPTNNSISETELKKYMKQHQISKITLRNGKLEIEYSDHHSEIKNITSEKEKEIQEYLKNHHNSVSFTELSSSFPNNKLGVGLIVGIVAGIISTALIAV